MSEGVYVLWSWQVPAQTWRPVMPGSKQRIIALAAQRQQQADAAGIPGARFLALPAGEKPPLHDTPGALPLDTPPAREPTEAEKYRAAFSQGWQAATTPGPHSSECWRLVNHHACTVALAEMLQHRVDELSRLLHEARRGSAA